MFSRAISAMAAVLMMSIAAMVQAQGAGGMGGKNADEYQRLAGKWQLVAAIHDGQALPANEIAQTTLVTEGNHFQLPQATKIGTSPAGTFTVNPDTNPKQVDSTATTGPDAGKVALGIYDVSGDLQIDCFAQPGAARPTDFTAPAGSGRTLQVWRRVGK